jgi:hypothetical protein
MVRPERLPNRYLRKFFRAVYSIAGCVGLLYAYAFLFQRAQLFIVDYPRYPVYGSQLFTLAAVALVIAGVVASGLWPRFARDYKDPRYEAWMDAAGFLLYLRTVFVDRFSAGGIATEDGATLRTYAAYAVAYGIIPAEPERVAEIIRLSR